MPTLSGVHQQTLAWAVLLFVLAALVTKRVRYDIASFAGLLVLGLFGVVTPVQLFSGFGNPALFTVAAVLVMSEGIVASGLMAGMGLAIAHRLHKPETQILSLSVVAGLLSAFMNNVGAIGLVLPTAKRMAARAEASRSSYGMPLVYASIVGGSITLIGTASNILVSSHRMAALGAPFKMFDFAIHGMVMSLTCLLLWFAGRLFGYDPMKERDEYGRRSVSAPDPEGIGEQGLGEPYSTRSRKKTILTLLATVPVIILTSMGILHSSVGFGLSAVILIAVGILEIDKAYRSLTMPVLIFIGSMIGITAALQKTGALDTLVSRIAPALVGLPPLLVIWIILNLTTIWSNILGNTVAAVLMAPLVVSLAGTGIIGVTPDSLLMAVAAGSSLGLVLPTHQATMVTQSHMHFSSRSFMKYGAVIALFGGITASLAIYAVWL